MSLDGIAVIDDAYRVGNGNVLTDGSGAVVEGRMGASYLALISHEIRTPLSGLLGVLTLLEQRIEAPEHRQIVRLAQASGVQLRLLLNDLIDLACADAGQFGLNISLFSPVALLEEISDFWRLIAEDRGLELCLKIDPSLSGLINGDPVRLRQVIENLLSNAIKFTRKGQVSLFAEHRNGSLWLDISDEGPGVSEEDARLLFKDFSRLNNGEVLEEGAGLGLSLCRQLVELMGGEIGLSTAGVGTRFYVRLPWVEGLPSSPLRSDQTVSRHEQLTTLTLPILCPSPQVLLVEDVQLSRLVLTAYLERMGCIVRTAENGQEAIEALRREMVDAVLMDMSMPVMDGVAATRAIRAMAGPIGRVPIIGITAYDCAADMDAMRAAGVNRFTPKPVDAALLLAALADLLPVNAHGNPTR